MRKRFTEEQIVGVLNEHAAGGTIRGLRRRHGITLATFHRWRAKYGGLRTSEFQRR